MYNCKTCLYANDLQSGLVMCDRKLLSENKEIYIEEKAAGLNCPVHSKKLIEETRYLMPNKYEHEDGSHCDVCRRRLDMKDETQYSQINIEDESGSATSKIQCRICKEKGRI